MRRTRFSKSGVIATCLKLQFEDLMQCLLSSVFRLVAQFEKRRKNVKSSWEYVLNLVVPLKAYVFYGYFKALCVCCDFNKCLT